MLKTFRGLIDLPTIAKFVIGAPGRIRTADHCVRSAVLYPAELRARRNFTWSLSGHSACGAKVYRILTS